MISSNTKKPFVLFNAIEFLVLIKSMVTFYPSIYLDSKLSEDDTSVNPNVEITAIWPPKAIRLGIHR